MDGILVIDKPPGMTSHDVVDVVRKRFGTRRVGHGGTLDPDATGVLIIGIGKATRLLSYAQAGPKRYEADARFGVVTSTQDASGEVLETRECDLTREQVGTAAGSFVGDLEQIPPMMSAVKVGGERLYRKARRGEDIERAARPVTVDRFELLSFDPTGPSARFDVICSGGTYVRTLIHDLGQALGCGAHLSALRRTAAGGFTLDDAVALDVISRDDLRPTADAVRDLPAIQLPDEAAAAVSHGRALDLEGLESPAAGPVAVIHDGELLAVYRRESDRLVPERVIPR